MLVILFKYFDLEASLEVGSPKAANGELKKDMQSLPWTYFG